MTTPTNENRDADRAEPDRAERDRVEPQPRSRLDLSVTKIAASACAAALAAAVGSKLGVAGTIVGAAMASVVATSAGAVIGHSLERGKTAARKAMPVLDPEQFETALLLRTRTARIARVEQQEPSAAEQTRIDEPVALTRVDEAPAMPSLADRALADTGLDETVVIDRGTPATPATGPQAQTVVLPRIAPPEARRTWKDRVPGRKPVIAAAVASFVIGTGAVTALEVARKGEFPGYHSDVFKDPGRSGGSHNAPAPQYPDGSGTHSTYGSTPSQNPSSPSPTPSGSSDQSPSTTPSTPPTSGSTPSTPTTPQTTPSTGPTTPATSPTGSADPTTAPSTPGASTPTSTNTGQGNATPSGGPTG